MSWHRMRKGVGGKPPSQEYQDKKAQLEELKRLDDEGKIDLYYLGETGFCLIPCVPYCWQDLGEYLTIPSRRSQRMNVLGIMRVTFVTSVEKILKQFRENYVINFV